MDANVCSRARIVLLVVVGVASGWIVVMASCLSASTVHVVRLEGSSNAVSHGITIGGASFETV